MNENENYIMLNGKKIPLTDEQVKLIQAEEPKKSPFDRALHGRTYFCVVSDFELYEDCECSTLIDDGRFNSANYCTDESIMKQHALHMLLNNLLWRYSMTHGGDEMDFNAFSIQKYNISYDSSEKNFYVDWNRDVKNVGAIYFKSHDTAEAAIVEIVKPFIKEHPDFDVTKM